MLEIDYAHLTLGHALIGGLMIGAAAMMMMVLLGRIMGVSGIVSGIVDQRIRAEHWRLGFVAGTIGGAILVGLMMPGLAQVSMTSSWLVLCVAGLLVGVGTRMSSGCTSGHGVCGIGRLSPRSLVATCVFMGSGIATVFVMRHVFQVI